MATTSIWPIKGGAGAIARLEAYIENPEKTCTPQYLEAQQMLHLVQNGNKETAEYTLDELKGEIACYVTGINCNAPDEAWQEMAYVYQCYDKPCEGRVCYHGYQSFKENEVTAEQAHEIGVELAQRLWGDRFQVVVATHMNTGHYHNHFLLNAISFADGLKFVNRKSDYRAMRDISDEICRRYGISVIENPKPKSRHSYDEWKAGNQIREDIERAMEEMGMQNPTTAPETATVSDMPKENSAVHPPVKSGARQDVRQDMDEAIRLSFTMREFIQKMESYGYVWNFNGKYPRIRPPGRERFFRLYKLGNGYDSIETLAKRIMGMQEKSRMLPKVQQTHFHYRGSFQKKPKARGLLAVYYYHCFRLSVFQKRQSVKHTPEYWQAAKQLRAYTKAASFLQGTGIRTMEELAVFKQNVVSKLEQCGTQIAQLNQKLAGSDSSEQSQMLLTKLETIQAKEKHLKEQLSICRLIEKQQHVSETSKTDAQAQR